MFTQLPTAETVFTLFCIFVGAGYQLFVRKNTEGLGTLARVYSQFSAVVILGGLMDYALITLHWNPILLGVGGFFACQGGARVIWLTAEFFDKQVDLVTALEQVGRAVSAFYNVLKSGDDPKPPTP